MRTNKYTQKRKGIVTPYGQWKYPGKITTIPSNDITMQGVPYPVLGVSDKGDMKMMLPGMDYIFNGSEVTEYPIMQKGGVTNNRKEDKEYIDWIENWLKNRKDILEKNADATTWAYKKIVPRNNTSDVFKTGFNIDRYSNYPNPFVLFKGYTPTENRVNKIIYSQVENARNVPVMNVGEGNSYDYQTRGIYKEPNSLDNSGHYVLFAGQNVDPSVKVHEFTHASHPIQQERYISDVIFKDREIPNVAGRKNNKNENAKELYGALQEFRFKNNLSPNEKMTQEWIDKNRNLFNGNYLENISDEDKLRLFNEVADSSNVTEYPIMQTGGIYIKKENKGKFTEAAKRAGKSVQAYAAQILANKENYSPTLVKRANFARNSAKWKHQEGGEKPSFEEYYQSLPAYKNDTMNYDLRTAYQYLPYEEMKQFATMPEKHLSSVVELPDGSYRFLKSKNHPSLQQELDWYNSDDAKEFRNNYTLDTSGEYYRYVPKKHQIGKYLEGNYVQPQTVGNVMNSWNDMLAKGLSKGDNIANWVGTGLQAAATAAGSIASQWGAANGKQDWMNEKKKEEYKEYFNLDNLKDNMFANPNNPQQIAIPPQTENWMARFNVVDDGTQQSKKYDRFRILNPDHIKNPEENSEYIEWFIPTDINKQKLSISKEPSLPGFKLATGGNTGQLAELEKGEILSNETGYGVMNRNSQHHEEANDKNETQDNIIEASNDINKEARTNPQITKLSKRKNPYEVIRRILNGEFIFPSTVGLSGILEPRNGDDYWLARWINGLKSKR